MADIELLNFESSKQIDKVLKVYDGIHNFSSVGQLELDTSDVPEQTFVHFIFSHDGETWSNASGLEGIEAEFNINFMGWSNEGDGEYRLLVTADDFGSPLTLYYKAFLFDKGDNTFWQPTGTDLPLQYSSTANYQKIVDTFVQELTVPFFTTQAAPPINHNLGYIPVVRCFYEVWSEFLGDWGGILPLDGLHWQRGGWGATGSAITVSENAVQWNFQNASIFMEENTYKLYTRIYYEEA